MAFPALKLLQGPYMLLTWLILSKFVTFRSTFVYDCPALVPVAGHFDNPRFLGRLVT
jgi:hypothetical protein